MACTIESGERIASSIETVLSEHRRLSSTPPCDIATVTTATTPTITNNITMQPVGSTGTVKASHPVENWQTASLLAAPKTNHLQAGSGGRETARRGWGAADCGQQARGGWPAGLAVCCQ